MALDLEYFDVLDGTARKTGDIIARDEAHRLGVWHGAFHCLIISEQNGTAQAFFQKRSLRKKIAPGVFDVSVGGHYVTGEDARTAGPREIREELGLNVRFEDLLPVGKRVCVYGFSAGLREHEFQDIFLLFRSVHPREFALQEEELDGVIAMDVEEGVKLFSGVVPAVACGFYKNGASEERVAVSSAQFVPCVDNYYLKLLLLVRRYLKGERDLLLI